MLSQGLILWIILAHIAGVSSITFHIQTSNTSGPVIPNEYVSSTIDASYNTKWNSSLFNSTQIQTLAEGLSPAFFRFGGTNEDYIIYCMNTTKLNSEPCMSSTRLFQLANFTKKVNWKLIFGLNAATQRYSNNSWNPTNARSLMQAIVNSGTVDYIHAYELGNEPNLYSKKNISISPQQNAEGFDTLYNLIQSEYGSTKFIPEIWGNDDAGPESDYFQQFLSNASITKHVDKITYHMYYCDGKTTQLSQFYNVTMLDQLIHDIDKAKEYIHTLYDKTATIILGETDGCDDGGVPNVSSSFANGFMYLDKLGYAASAGIYSVIRQEFRGYSSYAMVNGTDYYPNPDYYTAYLFKNLVGNKVIYVDDEFEYGRYVRVYAFCTRLKNEGSIYDYNKGSVTVVMLNLFNTTNEDFSVALDFIDGDTDSNGYGSQFILTSYPGVINSRSIYLNGNLIEMTNENSLPKLEGQKVNISLPIKVPTLSYGFVVADVKAKACL